jgi:hypothetical protein
MWSAPSTIRSTEGQTHGTVSAGAGACLSVVRGACLSVERGATVWLFCFGLTGAGGVALRPEVPPLAAALDRDVARRLLHRRAAHLVHDGGGGSR